MTVVVVTEPEFAKAAAVFRKAEGFECIPVPAEEAALAQRIRETGARHAIIGVVKYSGPLYDAIPAGGVIARFGVGHDGVDKAAARARGILCCNTPGVLDASVAECAVGLMLAVARNLAACALDAPGAAWAPRVGVELAGKTLTVIGCGSIGGRVARVARHGLGMRVVGFGRSRPADLEPYAEFSSDFAAAAGQADFVSVHIPDTAANRDFISRERLGLMKKGAILINTARGGVVDEDAVFDAITAGTIAGAGLDVFKQEPYRPQPSGKDLRTLPQVLMTPHIGSSTREACERMALAALRNIGHAIAGRSGEMNLIG
ncbi:MAG: hypothetical protein L6R48_06090 [Planctomycetes bacterium]|nr:hypothetical protein [Planctomycetota bacterium]